MKKIFPVVILSTWKEEDGKIPDGNFEVILNDKPRISGYSHRNLQRLSTAMGLKKAIGMGCEYVLKWRTDMLPTRFDLKKMMAWASYDVPEKSRSRIVTLAFRNLTVDPDWFSSIPDLFAFGHIEEMNLLWGDDGFDYSRQMNVPSQMVFDCGPEWMQQLDVGGIYSPETELYALYKNRMQTKYDLTLTHRGIAKNYLRLIDHHRLGVIWFSKLGGFRSIQQAWQYPWWTEEIWKQGEPLIIARGYPSKGIISKIKSFISQAIILREKLLQLLLLTVYKLNAKIK